LGISQNKELTYWLTMPNILGIILLSA